jgi:hypothetical protein
VLPDAIPVKTLKIPTSATPVKKGRKEAERGEDGNGQ